MSEERASIEELGHLLQTAFEELAAGSTSGHWRGLLNDLLWQVWSLNGKMVTGAADQGIVFDTWRLSGAGGIHGHAKSGERLAGPLVIAERTVRDRGLRPHAGCGTQALLTACRVASFG